MLNARGWVSVVELVVYVPAHIVAIIVCKRHGFRRTQGWIFTLLLCMVRILGAILQLLTYHDHSTGLIQATIIVDSIGLSPLLLATLGLLSRFVDTINFNSTSPFSTKHFRIIQLLITVGLILAIVGGTSGNISPNGTIQIPTESKAGIILYIVAYVALVLVCIISVPKVSNVPALERRVPLAVIVALPFILVRLVYSALSIFIHNHLFNIVNGSVVVLVVMAVLEEIFVVAIYLLLGLTVDSTKQHGSNKNRQHQPEYPKYDGAHTHELRQGGSNAV